MELAINSKLRFSELHNNHTAYLHHNLSTFQKIKSLSRIIIQTIVGKTFLYDLKKTA
jgi:hypothetical protein